MPCTRSPSHAVTIATVAARRPSSCFRASRVTVTAGSPELALGAPPKAGPPSGRRGTTLVRLDLVDAVLRVELLVGEDHVDLAREAALRVLLVLHPVDVHGLAFGDLGDLALLSVDRDRGPAQHRAGRVHLEGRLAAFLHLEIRRRLRALALLRDLERDEVRGRVELDPLALALRALGLVVRREGSGDREQAGGGDREGSSAGEARHGVLPLDALVPRRSPTPGGRRERSKATRFRRSRQAGIRLLGTPRARASKAAERPRSEPQASGAEQYPSTRRPVLKPDR